MESTYGIKAIYRSFVNYIDISIYDNIFIIKS